jgi:hypothetical protein
LVGETDPDRLGLAQPGKDLDNLVNDGMQAGFSTQQVLEMAAQQRDRRSGSTRRGSGERRPPGEVLQTLRHALRIHGPGRGQNETRGYQRVSVQPGPGRPAGGQPLLMAMQGSEFRNQVR